MSFPFQAQHGPVVVQAELEGPAGAAVLSLALDTGATTTVISVRGLLKVGHDPAQSTLQSQVTTGSGTVSAPLVPVQRLKALGQERAGLAVLALTLPPTAGIDGVLGLDFLRGQVLTIDFRLGEITLS